MRADRLVATLLTLQARGRVTAAQLAEELEVSVATARRDLEALSAAGIPVYPQAGRVAAGSCSVAPAPISAGSPAPRRGPSSCWWGRRHPSTPTRRQRCASSCEPCPRASERMPPPLPRRS